MSSNSFRALVLFGSGPGIGRHVASRFAEGHFQHIILLSRDQRRLEEDASIVRSAGPGASVDIVPCDLSQLQSVRKALDSVAQKLQERGTHLEVVCFNAARVAKTQLLATPPEEMDTDFKVVTHSAFNLDIADISRSPTPPFSRSLSGLSRASNTPFKQSRSNNSSRLC
jgi:NAD(P)-dependent dehydrogenase (short-subunit alcohol dehydrogenase family)